MRQQVVMVSIVATLIACDSSAPTRPDDTDTSPPPQEPVPQIVSITITGDARFTALHQVHPLTATAQMVSGPPRNVTAESDWSSSDPGVVTVSKNGEVTSVGVGLATVTARYVEESSPVIKESSLDVVVAPVERSGMTGLYRLAFTAACEGMPDWAKHREYDATIEQRQSDPPLSSVSLTLIVQLQPGFAPRFGVSIKGSRVHVWFPTDEYYGGDPIFSHRVDAGSLFTLRGEARGTKGGSRIVEIAGTLAGVISAVNPMTNRTLFACGSSKHQFSLVRR